MTAHLHPPTKSRFHLVGMIEAARERLYSQHAMVLVGFTVHPEVLSHIQSLASQHQDPLQWKDSATLLYFGMEFRSNRYLPPNRALLLGRRGEVLGVVDLDKEQVL
jgi:hypothetical protein